MRTLPAFLLTLALMFGGVAAVAAPAALAHAGRPSAGHAAPAYVACGDEDGSTPGQAFPCWWDAATQGNGLGESYALAEPMTCDYAQSFGPTAGCPPVDH